jgi:hypothetical protein
MRRRKRRRNRRRLVHVKETGHAFNKVTKVGEKKGKEGRGKSGEERMRSRGGRISHRNGTRFSTEGLK